MIPLLTSAQIRDADAHTIQHEPITSADLMERAATAFVSCFIRHYTEKDQTISVYCGTGNNGGDGLAVARLLREKGYLKIRVFIARFSTKQTDDFARNHDRLKRVGIILTDLNPGVDFPADDPPVIIDALLGTGLNKVLDGEFARLVKHLNSLSKTVVAVDVPTGFFCEGEIPADAEVLRARLVITFQQPKLNFLLPESATSIESFETVDIGLNKSFIASLDSPFQFVEEADIRDRIKTRKPFGHKGTYGHALVIAGQPETMGAAILCASACAHTGAGLTTACIPQSGLTALNTVQPEVMTLLRYDGIKPEIDWDKFNAIAIGPGLGIREDSLAILNGVLRNFKKPLVIDADALNLLGANSDLLNMLPPGSILTPHVKEFDRLFGVHQNWWQRIETISIEAKNRKIFIVLKNRFTIAATPAGKLYFNPTGNPAMASGGMGDVLTGVLLALLAQGYSAGDTCLTGVYLHGKAGDELALLNQSTTVLASAVAKNVPVTMAKIKA